MKKEALIFTDLHLNDINKDICFSFINKLIEYAKSNNIENLFFMGDMIDVRKGPSEMSLNAIYKIFEKISNTNLKLFYFAGNHDKYIEDGESSYLELFSHLCPFLSRNVELVEIQNSKYNYLLFPYFEGKCLEEALNKIKNIKLKKPTILLAHYMYEQIPKEICDKFEKIFLGHNHDRDNFQNGMYIGSCFPQNFSEDNKKGFTVLYEDLTTELISFSYNQYLTLQINVDNKEKNEIEENILNFRESNLDKNLKIKFIGYNKDISYFLQICKNLNIYFEVDIKNNAVNIKEEFIDCSNFSFKKILEQFNLFCKENNIEEQIKEKIENILIKNKNE